MVKIILVILAVVIAALYQLETDSSYWAAHSTVRLDVFPDEVMRFIANVDQMEKWFSLVSYVRQADFKTVDVNKQYHVFYNIPWIGEYGILFKVVKYETNKLVCLESESILKPKVEFILNQENQKETLLTIRIHFRRNSMLFQVAIERCEQSLLIMD